MQLPDDDAVASTPRELREGVRRQRVGGDQRCAFPPDKDQVPSDPRLKCAKRYAGFLEPLTVEGD
jgi:hypothetical protein